MSKNSQQPLSDTGEAHAMPLDDEDTPFSGTILVTANTSTATPRRTIIQRALRPNEGTTPTPWPSLEGLDVAKARKAALSIFQLLDQANEAYADLKTKYEALEVNLNNEHINSMDALARKYETYEAEYEEACTAKLNEHIEHLANIEKTFKQRFVSSDDYNALWKNVLIQEQEIKILKLESIIHEQRHISVQAWHGSWQDRADEGKQESAQEIYDLTTQMQAMEEQFAMLTPHQSVAHEQHNAEITSGRRDHGEPTVQPIAQLGYQYNQPLSQQQAPGLSYQYSQPLIQRQAPQPGYQYSAPVARQQAPPTSYQYSQPVVQQQVPLPSYQHAQAVVQEPAPILSYHRNPPMVQQPMSRPILLGAQQAYQPATYLAQPGNQFTSYTP